MNQAQYRVHVPVTDRLGQSLHPKLPSAAHQWLHGSQPRLFHDIWVEGPHQHGYGPAHHVVAIAEDSPESDSFVKQLAAHVGEIANHPFIPVSKHGKDGVQSWTIPNRRYIDGIGADPEMLAPVIPSIGGF